MSHWIAFSWDKNQILLLTARTKKGKAFFEKAVRILPDLPDVSSHAPSSDSKIEQNSVVAGFTPETVKAKLRHFVQQERLGKYDTVVVVGRDDVEVRSMIFPPVPNDEIPEMARFQASKEFTEYDATASLDFVLFDGARKDKKHILAASLTKARRETIEDIVTGAGLDLQRVVLGPCESAKRFSTITVQQRTGGAGKTTLLVEMGEYSATLILLYRGMAAFVRTAHFQKPIWSELDRVNSKQFENAEELANWKWLTADFKRTIVAAINDVPSEKVDEIVLCGTGERYEKLVRLLEESLAVPVSLFNVWRFENREGEIANHLPVYEEQFLPLIGALTPALAEKPNALDFKNPKRKPEKQSKRHLITLAIAVSLILVFVLGGWGFYRRMSLESELEILNAQMNSLKENTARTDRLKSQNDVIAKWQENDVDWLEQLEWLSNSIPPDEDVILNGNLALRAPVNANPTIVFTALTRGTTVAPLLEQNLRDETHTVRSPKAEQSNDRTYTQKRELTVTILPPPKEKPKAKSDTPTTSQEKPPAEPTEKSPDEPVDKLVDEPKPDEPAEVSTPQETATEVETADVVDGEDHVDENATDEVTEEATLDEPVEESTDETVIETEVEDAIDGEDEVESDTADDIPTPNSQLQAPNSYNGGVQ